MIVALVVCKYCCGNAVVDLPWRSMEKLLISFDATFKTLHRLLTLHLISTLSFLHFKAVYFFVVIKKICCFFPHAASISIFLFFHFLLFFPANGNKEGCRGSLGSSVPAPVKVGGKKRPPVERQTVHSEVRRSMKMNMIAMSSHLNMSTVV